MSHKFKARGFTLVEMAIVLVILVVAVAAVAPMAGAMREQSMRKETETKLAALDQAMVNYLMANSRLPCPANGTIATGAANAGVEQPLGGGVCTAMTTGVLPWVTLGLTEADAVDAWGNRFTYRVVQVPQATATNAFANTTSCDPAGTKTALPISNFNCTSDGAGTGTDLTKYYSASTLITGRGLNVFNEAGTAINSGAGATGAAYVLISHGAVGGGAYTPSGTLMPLAGNGGNEENWNGNNQVLRAGATGYFHASSINESATAAHFDDIMSHPSIMTLLTKAGLAPRAH